MPRRTKSPRKLYTPDESVHTPQSKAKKKNPLKPKSGSVKRRRPGSGPRPRKRVRPGSSGVKRRKVLLQGGGRGR